MILKQASLTKKNMTKLEFLPNRHGTPSASNASTARRSYRKVATRGILTSSARKTSTGQCTQENGTFDSEFGQISILNAVMVTGKSLLLSFP